MITIIKKLENKVDLNTEDLNKLFNTLEKKEYSDSELELLVRAWEEKGKKAEELETLVRILFSKEKQITDYNDALDLCGTGGDKLNTFNISTISAIVTSSLGIKTIKHSGRSATSISGSVDILNQFGLELDQHKNISEECYKKTNLMFTSSKKLREVFGDIKKISKKIDIPSIVNLIGPLSNPYKTKYHILGVSNPNWGELMAKTLSLLDKDNKALIVCTKINEKQYLDELSFCGENFIWKLDNGEISKETFSIKGLGKELVNINRLRINDLNDAKLTFESILKGKINKELEPKTDTVALNSGAALYLTNRAASLLDGYEKTLKHIQNNSPWEHFQIFLNCSSIQPNT